MESRNCHTTKFNDSYVNIKKKKIKGYSQIQEKLILGMHHSGK